jgi:DNA invertase Pin-like site-specific DNA recombinase
VLLAKGVTAWQRLLTHLTCATTPSRVPSPAETPSGAGPAGPAQAAAPSPDSLPDQVAAQLVHVLAAVAVALAAPDPGIPTISPAGWAGKEHARVHRYRVLEGHRRPPHQNGFAVCPPVHAEQVLHNTESAVRQYDLRGRAIALGWRDDQITVIDIDQGQSGASAADREGFQQLVAEVSLGRAGIVLGLECSRLARNSADWHQLLELCGITGTLICDEDGLYDPRTFNDRLLLGMKGQMSEAELHFIRARLRGGVLSKARRGELITPLPVGLVYDGAATSSSTPTPPYGVPWPTCSPRSRPPGRRPRA